MKTIVPAVIATAITFVITSMAPSTPTGEAIIIYLLVLGHGIRYFG